MVTNVLSSGKKHPEKLQTKLTRFKQPVELTVVGGPKLLTADLCEWQTDCGMYRIVYRTGVYYATYHTVSAHGKPCWLHCCDCVEKCEHKTLKAAIESFEKCYEADRLRKAFLESLEGPARKAENRRLMASYKYKKLQDAVLKAAKELADATDAADKAMERATKKLSKKPEKTPKKKAAAKPAAKKASKKKPAPRTLKLPKKKTGRPASKTKKRAA